jgi:hypothetical protein
MTRPGGDSNPERRPGRKLVHFRRIGIEAPGLSADTLARNSMVTQPTGHDMRDGRLNDIQRQVVRGEYRVDPQAVADAILRRLLGDDGLGGPPPHDPCS